MVYNFGMRSKFRPKFYGGRRRRAKSEVVLQVLQWNAGGLSQAKRLELVQTVLKEDIDVFAIMEANLTNDTLKYYPFPGYNLYLLPKYRKIASGILVGVKKNLTTDFKICKEMGETVDKSEITVINVWKEGTFFKIYALYIPPASKPDLSIISISRKTIVIGDMNAHSSRWGYQDRNAAGAEIEDLLDSSILELIYDSHDLPTFIHYNGSCTTPDLLCVSSDLSASTKRRVLSDTGSGHRQIIASIGLVNDKGQDVPSPMKSWNFKKADWEKFESLTKEKLHIGRFNLSSHPSKIVSEINKEILACAKLSIPRGKVKEFKCFWSRDLEDIKIKRDRLRRKAELTKNPKDVTSWRRQVAVLKKCVLEAKRKAFDEFISTVDYKKDSLRTYKFMSSLQNKRPSCRKEPINCGDKLLTSDRDIANAFARSYAQTQRKGIFARKIERQLKRERRMRNSNLNGTNLDGVFNVPFSMQELNSTLRCLKVKKAPGDDFVHVEFLKHLCITAKETILHIFNQIWETGIVPSQWKRAVIIPMLKKDKDPGQVSNYRPISLTSILGKTMERLVVNRLNWFLEDGNKIANEQAGFRKNRSASDQVTLFSQTVKDALDNRNILSAIYIDFKNAYDLVWKEKLYQKLLNLGIGGRMLNWILSFTDQRICRVKYGNEYSRFQNLQTGLPQGAVCSCVLFNIYINDLIHSLRAVEGVHCLLYADDLVIWTQEPKKIAKFMIENRLNRAMSVLSDWCIENNMIVNLEKTALQSFSLMHQVFRPEVKYRNVALVTTDEFKYLGITFDSKLNWRAHVESMVKRCSSRMTILKRLAGSLWGCARSTANNTYKAFVLPLITYCCEPLISASNQALEKLEIIQNQAMRLITGAVKSTPIDSMLLLTKNRPIKTIIEEKAILLYEKLIRLEDPFWVNYQIHTRNLKTQCGFIQKVFDILQGGEPRESPQKIMKPINPLEIYEVEFNLNLVNKIFKKDTAPDALRCFALELIYTDYPEENWLHVYTDGSYSISCMAAGSGVFSKLFSFSASAGKNRTAFDGEVEAIRIALEQLLDFRHEFEKVVLLSDSQAAIQAIGYAGAPISAEVLQCRELVRRISREDKHIKLQWIPGHCGIYGNDQADLLARRGAFLQQTNVAGLSFHSKKLFWKQALKLKFEAQIQDRVKFKSWRSEDLANIPDCPRREAVALFRLVTGHDCLSEHLHRIGIFDSPLCLLCDLGEPFNRAHLRRCRALCGTTDSETTLYWRARERLRQ